MARTLVVAVVGADADAAEREGLLALGADTVEVAATDDGVIDDIAGLAVAAVRGAPAVRTRDVRAARRIVDVIAAIGAIGAL